MKGTVYSLMIIDDHPIIHSGLDILLGDDENLSIDANATSATEAMKLLKTTHPDVVIVDLSLGDSDGIYLVQKIHSKYPLMRILVYSMSEEKIFGERVANAGALGYVMKTSKQSDLRKAIHTVIGGQLFFSSETKKRLARKQEGKPIPPQSRLDHLSNREIDIFKLIGDGLNTVHISAKLNISKNTVDTHRINIKKKLELQNGKALDRMAYEVIMQGRLPKKK